MSFSPTHPVIILSLPLITLVGHKNGDSLIILLVFYNVKASPLAHKDSFIKGWEIKKNNNHPELVSGTSQIGSDKQPILLIRNVFDVWFKFVWIKDR